MKSTNILSYNKRKRVHYMAESWTNFPGQFGPITVVLKRQAYLNNKRLAVEVVAKQDGAEVSYAIVTKNFSDEVVSGPDCGFFDVNNYGYIFKWMLEEGICIPTGHFADSGFCIYPEVKFDLEVMQDGDSIEEGRG